MRCCKIYPQSAIRSSSVTSFFIRIHILHFVTRLSILLFALTMDRAPSAHCNPSQPTHCCPHMLIHATRENKNNKIQPEWQSEANAWSICSFFPFCVFLPFWRNVCICDLWIGNACACAAHGGYPYWQQQRTRAHIPDRVKTKPLCASQNLLLISVVCRKYGMLWVMFVATSPLIYDLLHFARYSVTIYFGMLYLPHAGWLALSLGSCVPNGNFFGMTSIKMHTQRVWESVR